MSEFTSTKENRLKNLLELSRAVLETGNARPFIIENQDFISTVIPSDFIALFDELVKEGYPVNELKTCSNKILNIFHLPVENYIRLEPEPDSFLYVLEQNNREMEKVLNNIKPVFKIFVKNTNDFSAKKELLLLFEKLGVFVTHYAIKENVLFPVIEKTWPDYRCLQIMWSFQDDIRRNIRYILDKLKSDISDLKEFNRRVGDVFFNMMAIKFREEKILFPTILSTISAGQLEEMNREGFEIGYPYIQPEKTNLQTVKPADENGLTDLGTGSLTIEQIKLIFNHLPVDITFVDEHNRVRYFSTPKKRIFRRTNAIIGREVNNCHPPESVHVVEKIVESFRNGEKNKADFWIKMKGEYVLIQYFAVRDEHGNYRGVIEVSQEISDIKTIEGEKKLLDW